jgi:hypothetical protein
VHNGTTAEIIFPNGAGFNAASAALVRRVNLCKLCHYLLTAIMKKDLRMEPSLHEIPRTLSLTLHENMPIFELFYGESRKAKLTALVTS